MARFVLVVWLAAAAWAQGAEYKSAREAKSEASKHLRSGNFAAAQEPLEAALRLTPATDNKDRVEIYRSLMAPYRLLGEPDKMMEAVEYILANSDSQAERSNIARDFVSFMHQRGKTDETVARYEQRLKENEKDPMALAVLSTIYLRIKSDKKARGEELKASLGQLDQQRASAKAEKLTASADADAASAASNWKDVAKAWLEAGNKTQARVAIDRSRTADPERRSELLTMYWQEGIGDVLIELGETADAKKAYEAALAAAPATLKKTLQTKLDRLQSPKK